MGSRSCIIPAEDNRRARDPLGGFQETRAQDGGQVFGGHTVQVQVDCTQRLDREPHSRSGWATSPAWEAPGGVIRAAPASVRPRPEHKQSPLDGATPRMTAAAIAGRGAGPTPIRRLGTKWESRALARALHSSIPLTCARVHLRKYGPDLVVAIGTHGWGSRGRRFKSGRPDWFYEHLIDQLGTKPAMIVPIWPRRDEQDVSKAKPGQMRVAPRQLRRSPAPFLLRQLQVPPTNAGLIRMNDPA